MIEIERSKNINPPEQKKDNVYPGPVINCIIFKLLTSMYVKVERSTRGVFWRMKCEPCADQINGLFWQITYKN